MKNGVIFALLYIFSVDVLFLQCFRRGKDPIRRGIQAVKDGVAYTCSSLSPANIKRKFGEMQKMTIPELIVGFFKMIFYSFYYSGYGVSIVIGYFVNVLLSLMRGSQVEEPVQEVKEEEKVGPMRVLPALPAPEEPPNQMQAFGLDITKEENGQ